MGKRGFKRVDFLPDDLEFEKKVLFEFFNLPLSEYLFQKC